MLEKIIVERKAAWLADSSCPARAVVDYIRARNELREPQIEAIETYLFLKIAGGCRSVAQLFAGGFFNENYDLRKLNINEHAREQLEQDSSLRALFEFARRMDNGKKISADIETAIIDNPDGVDATRIISALFYNEDYADWLFSLPMGAGKTFLMAAFIYLDLYFSETEPDNDIWARNFLLLIPSGLKSSIAPSLKSIAGFDPSWVVPEPAAGNLKRLLRFEILDELSSAKKSNRARNPNAQKVAAYQPFEDLRGLVLIVNAEKVILDRLDVTARNGQLELIETAADERDRLANELRNLIGRIPGLQIHIDEVHHAANDEIKLRQVVNRWQRGGVINSVIGYSGTPYLPKPEKISVTATIDIKVSQITNTVYFYPLLRAVQTFLKKPAIRHAEGLSSLELVKNGVEEFQRLYGNHVYQNGARAKMAIYCGKIERLEEEIYSYLTNDLRIAPQEILKYHGGNAQYKLPAENAAEFRLLDTPYSQKKYILLVNIGKEGWDCRSLTAVALSQKGDCPVNMVLQTACRCLRQVDKGAYETALVWLNSDNAKALAKQLQEEQRIDIEELNNAARRKEELAERYNRVAQLRLPKVEYYQLNVRYEEIIVAGAPDTRARLNRLATELDNGKYRTVATVDSGGLEILRETTAVYGEIAGDKTGYSDWLNSLARDSCGTLGLRDLRNYDAELTAVFERIATVQNGKRYYNVLVDGDKVAGKIRSAFQPQRSVNISEEVIPAAAELLLAEKLGAVDAHDKLFPAAKDVANIIAADKGDYRGDALPPEQQAVIDALRPLAASGVEFARLQLEQIERQYFSAAVRNKDRTLHYLPYDFRQSGFELQFMQELLALDAAKNLEVYYNGERALTEFKIRCYAKLASRKQFIGQYTPDFLLIERKDSAIHKALIIETKGGGFAAQSEFVSRREFVENEFIKFNNAKFGYRRFEYIVLPDDQPLAVNLQRLNAKIAGFFK